VITPSQDIGQVNGPHAAVARVSRALPWNRLDAVPQEISDRVLWAAIHGSTSPPPRPGPNASPAEHARAVLVWSALMAHKDVRTLLAGRDR
jgi:hypothetical protein